MRLPPALLLFSLAAWPTPAGAWPRRTPLPGRAPALWALEEAFPGQALRTPVAIVLDPSDRDRLLVLERAGRIQALRRREGAWEKEPSPFLDIADKTFESFESGLLGLAFHPEFGRAGSPNRGFLYVFYTARAGSGLLDRLSRFTVADGARAPDPGSELVLIDQSDEADIHNGGGLQFGPDGFLYVGVGDEGVGGGNDAGANAQRIDKDLFSGILRLDVDRRGGRISHAPARQPETGRTAGYFIPNDNPFVGAPDALEEFWSIGLRNPFRLSFDSGTGKLWVAEVGQNRWESIVLAERGSNHGWSHLEGGHPFESGPSGGKPPAVLHGSPTPPVYAYPHTQGRHCVLGGFVYRGRKFPELRGRYLFGDWGSGKLMALPTRGSAREPVEIATLFGEFPTMMQSVAEGPDGEVYLACSTTVLKLARPEAERLPVRFARRLSRTGAFEDMRALSPAAGFLPYDVNVPLWSEGTGKMRWLRLPAPRARIGFDPTGSWSFPPGSVFIKHFALPAEEGGGRLETRILVRTRAGVEGASYLWDEDGTEARRVDAALEVKRGGRRRLIPGPADCRQCHNRMAGYVLGVNARQLNRSFATPGGGQENQLAALARAGLFDRPVSPEGLPRLRALSDEGAPDLERLRSYLDANCAQCHRRPGVRGVGGFDARFETPWELQQLVGKVPGRPIGPVDPLLISPGRPELSILLLRLNGGLGEWSPNFHMPPIGTGVPDEAAVRLLERFIRSMPAEKS